MSTTNQTPTHSRVADRLRSLLALAILLTTAVSVTMVTRQADAADDIDLLRENGGNPFVMILLDTSASMALAPPQEADHKDYLGDLAAAAGDDPASKLFQAKQALYNVLSRVENVSFGFVEFNKDRSRVLRKHWLYLPERSADLGGVLPYPVATMAADSETTNAANRNRLETGWVFGDPDGLEPGTCTSPIEFDTNDKVNTDILLNRFPKNLDGGSVRHWIEVKNTTYALDIEATSGSVGDASVDVEISLSEVVACPTSLMPLDTETVTFRRYTDFLMVEMDTRALVSGGNADVGVESAATEITRDNAGNNPCKKKEDIAGFWNLQDIEAEGTCGSGSTRPFTGGAAELNFDAGEREDPDTNPNPDDADEFCWTSSGSETCYNLRFPTNEHARWPELDSGDFIPMDWEVDHREDFLKRLNPRHPEAPDRDETRPSVLREYFGVASFFEDDPDAADLADGVELLRLKDDEQKPIMAFGQSPLARVVNDVRCWYLGDADNKCKAAAYETGFEDLFRDYDSAFKCRIPYLIVITDGEEDSNSEDSTADFSTFDNEAGIRNWVFTFQDTSTFQSIISSTDGEIITIADQDDLETKLEEVIGTITQSTRTFATAAVPSVQAAIESRIYLTKFQPLNDAAVWEGHIHSFRLPMPDGRDDVPNATYPNHIWDAAVEMLAQAPDRPDDGDLSGFTDKDLLQIGPGATQRRVLWGRSPAVDSLGRAQVPAATTLFLVSPEDDGETVAPATAEEMELWDSLNLSYDSTDDSSVARVRTRANDIVRETLVEKESLVDSETDDLESYILGDVFHSNPLVVGGPVNTRYFTQDAEQTYDDDGAPQGTGYRDFFNEYENRRKVLLAGANDGMLHAFEAGVPGIQDDAGVDSVEFTEGSGREIFSFIPTEAMPLIQLAAENAETHRWGVDGSPAAGDVFIDPLHAGAPTAGQREWRTVVVNGMREGGTGYFALDITNPDPQETETIGPAGATRSVMVIEDRPDGTTSDPLSLQPTESSLIVPGCYADPDGDASTPSNACGDSVPYPALLWQFQDQVRSTTDEAWVGLDEDGNGFRDLGETWSTPDIGRIRVLSGGEVVNKYVAVFGGGLDPSKVDSRGNWIYMVDVETGQAIYKRKLEGSAPSDPATVDTDQDGYFDRVYIGTTAGKLYRVDLVEVDDDGDVVYPTLEAAGSVDVRGLDGVTYKATAPARIEAGTADEPLWEPRLIFDAAETVDGVEIARPIYYPPTVLFVSNLGEYAVGFGVGDRDDLTSLSGLESRFYLFVDETDQIDDADLPMVEGDLARVDLDDPANADLLTDPTLSVGKKGWFLALPEGERLIGTPFAFSGITFFATYDAEVVASCEVTCPDKKDLPEGETCTECTKPTGNNPTPGPENTPHCTITGNSHIYVVGTTDADAFLEDDDGLTRSYDIAGQFVTSPFTEQAVTSTNTGDDDGGDGDDGDGDDDPAADPLTESEQALMEKLKELFPDRCKFGNHRIDVKVIRADSEIERIAAVPICIVEKNWKELSE